MNRVTNSEFLHKNLKDFYHYPHSTFLGLEGDSYSVLYFENDVIVDAQVL